MDDGGCDHEFVDQGRLFSGTDGARLCRHCERVEVVVDGDWIDFDEYLRRRRSSPPPSSTGPVSPSV